MTPAVLVLLLANIAVYLLQGMVPGLGDALAFIPGTVLTRPWTLVTYMFLHGNLSHIAFNMLALFFFGQRIEQRMGSRDFLTLYFASGVTGALLSMLFSGAWIIGASGGMFGVMLAFAWFWPDERIFIWGVLPVPARILVIGTTALALFGGFGGSRDGVAHFAHLGGYVGAFLYLKWLDRNRGKFRKLATAPPPAAAQKVEKWRSVDLTGVHEVNRPEVRRILDKIAAEGVGKLSAQEKTFIAAFLDVKDVAGEGPAS